FLGGHIRRSEDLAPGDFRRTSPRFQGDNLSKNLMLVQRLSEIAREKGVTPAQLSLAWVLAQDERIVPIPGTKRRRYLQENLAASHIHLSAADLARIAEAAPKGAASGTRYAEPMMRFVNV